MKPVERQSFSSLLGNSFYFCLFYFYFMSMLQSRMLESRVWKLEATRKQCGYVRSLQIFLVFFKLRLRVQTSREPWRSVFRSFPRWQNHQRLWSWSQRMLPLLLEDKPLQLDPVQCKQPFRLQRLLRLLDKGVQQPARRAYWVVQTGQGSSKVRALSPSAIRAVETPLPGWHQAYGLDVVISGWRHRVLPDGFISDAVQYPEL